MTTLNMSALDGVQPYDIDFDSIAKRKRALENNPASVVFAAQRTIDDLRNEVAVLQAKVDELEEQCPEYLTIDLRTPRSGWAAVNREEFETMISDNNLAKTQGRQPKWGLQIFHNSQVLLNL